MKQHCVKVIHIQKCAYDRGNPDHIVTAFLNFQLNRLNLWGFVPNWTTIFPYSPKSSKYGKGEELISNLVGRDLKIEIHFLALVVSQNENKIKGFFDPQSKKKPCDYKIVGEIKKIQKSLNQNDFESLTIDCGFLLEGIKAEEGKFKVGDFITVEGRLDIEIKKILD